MEIVALKPKSHDHKTPGPQTQKQKANAAPAPSSSQAPTLDLLQERIGYRFASVGLLQQALTHGSYSTTCNNKRMGFLGDSVLGAVIVGLLYKRFPNSSTNELAKSKSMLVNNQKLAEIARQINLGEFLLLSKEFESKHGRENDSILANAMEAIIGAAYLDGGLEASERVIVRLWPCF